MKILLFKNMQTSKMVLLCGVAFAGLLISPAIIPSVFQAYAQTPLPWGAGKGGDGGKTVDGIAGQPGEEGNKGVGGRGGKGGTGTEGSDGGTGGTYDELIQTSTTLGGISEGQDGGPGSDAGPLVGLTTIGGGGGGGGTGLIVNGSFTPRILVAIKPDGAISGGNGGTGGAGFYDIATQTSGGGGNGGSGGAGAYVHNGYLLNNGVIKGGDGGTGGASLGEDGLPGQGGAGGWGVILTTGSSLSNNGTITGGNGGAGGAADNGWPAAPSSGGAGVYLQSDGFVQNLSQIQGGLHGDMSNGTGAPAIHANGDNNRVFNAGMIAAGGGIASATAILLQGNNNELRLFDNSQIIGTVIAQGNNNRLAFDNAYDMTFNASLIGEQRQYQGFTHFIKEGEGILELHGSTNSLTPWTAHDSILAIMDDKSLGSADGTLTLDGGTLQLMAFDPDDVLEMHRTIKLVDHAETANVIDTSDDNINIIYSSIEGEGGLIKDGPGLLVLAADNSYEGLTVIDEGTLQVGIGGSSGKVQGPILIEDEAVLTFNRSDIFTVDNLLGGNGNIRLTGTGTAIFTATNDEFDGTTTIHRGTLMLQGRLDGTINVGENGVLSGSGFANDVLNMGAIIPGGTAEYGTLTLAGNYHGASGSTINIKSALGGDNSPTDRLVIMGDASGASHVVIQNMEGNGGDTQKGIEVIAIAGQSNADFTLIGDYELPSGTPAVIAGAHSYVLEKGEASNPSDGNWYLRNNVSKTVCPLPEPGQPVPPCEPSQDIYQPGVPLYAGYSQLVTGLNTLSSMQQRIGNRYWNNASGKSIAQGDGPGGGLEEAPDPMRGEFLTDAGLVWGRIEAAHNRVQLHDSTFDNQYDADRWSLRAGIDRPLWEFSDSVLIGSVWLQYEHVKADISSTFGAGNIDVNSYSLGTALTWLDDSGFYLDGQARVSWNRSDLASSTLNETLVENAKGDGFALSLEAGQRITLNNIWSLTPQAQLTWSQSAFDDIAGPYNAAVSFDTYNNLTARAGLAVEYANAWQDAGGYTVRSKVYGIANLYSELLGKSPWIVVSGDKIKTGNTDRNWGEIGMGGSYVFRNEKYALFGEAAAASGLDKIGDSYSLRGNIGLRVRW